MTRLSVNINKVALIRNSRGSNQPDLVQVAKDCEAFGAQGITVHPRPDQRHIRYDDVPALKPIVTTEFNIEGNPTPEFLDLVLAHRPDQCTLVPDTPGQLTSDHGWDTVSDAPFLKDVTARLKEAGIRVSLFVDADEKMVEGAKAVGADRIEFYTGHYAHEFAVDPEQAVAAHRRGAKVANEVGIGINAGHDLNLDNLRYYAQEVPGLLEVSIGHALICDALYYGLQNTIQMYLRQLS
ncbi:pyridoxine 5'-phosphate synthase [Flavilitoribacter nigricans]|uniref:Pyridoxine 5'-phosphate synthase n=1 Tax=Flavilitoribacter nigricans (strain ATCC 23147 / DSM 23189 / NBRC 102662 / NCIMB 1420 / SS-2) TaxID=1122177 RepID=A0A2D0NHH5_FLAN2|nr:pyridoxine 5'-phosphate synthase [Flavilitoribacter nigricans]PHN07223.1 pyridoxine 5'-phosphate synthase [Flavilitoribacter nigricans DSM 23189 = NBRC 102662]